MTEEEFQNEKERLLEIVVPHILHPDMFGCPELTLEEIAILQAPDKDHVVSKMAVCKFIGRTLEKLKGKLAEIGINSLDDAFDTHSCRDRQESNFMPEAV